MLVSAKVGLDELGEPHKSVTNKLFTKKESALRAALEKTTKSVGAVEADLGDDVKAVIDLHLTAFGTADIRTVDGPLLESCRVGRPLGLAEMR